jgi:hypothetical protein
MNTEEGNIEKKGWHGGWRGRHEDDGKGKE